MTSGPLAKRSGLDALLADADYFAHELARRLDRLAEIQPRFPWSQAAVLARKIRGLARLSLRRRRRHARRLERLAG